MRTETVVLNNTKMQIIHVAVGNYLLAQKYLENSASKVELKSLEKLQERLENQLVKSFGDFKFDLRDCAGITMLVNDLWNAYKRKIESTNNNQVSYTIKKNIFNILDTFTGCYMNLDPDVKDGMEFRKTFSTF